MRILILEDDPLIGLDLLDIVQECGHEVIGLCETLAEMKLRLSERPERRLRMAQLADAMCHSRSRVTHTVQRMEGAGYLERILSPEDGRGILAKMTDAGRTLLERAAHVHVTGVRANLVDLVSDDDFAAVGRAMNAVADHLVSRHPASEIR